MEQVFPMVPASGKEIWVLAPILLLLLGLMGLFVYIGYSARQIRFEVSPAGLNIVGGLYSRMVPAAALKLSEAGRVSIRKPSEYAPCLRTNGIGLPGYQAGWFNLANREKALLFVTTEEVVRIPTTDNFSLLLSVQNPDEFLGSLRKEMLKKGT
ncbi:PH domain-containing protein [Nitrospira sp. BLG_2]|uniref:PH domain-containing protein n=1 Tax=Nitrospira sp. BLG_2 TaxID=3397507 RepID=UPI003B9AEA92